MSFSPLPLNYKIAFLGAGRMATALAVGFVKSGQVTAKQISAADISQASRQAFSHQVLGCQVFEDSDALPDQADLLILAVKPQVASSAVGQLKPLSPKTKILSVMAGVRMSKLQRWLSTKQLIRCIPNTPSLINVGAIGLAAEPEVAESDLEVIASLLRSVGLVVRVSEEQLDAITGLSGSGPAFVFSFIRAMIAGGVEAGLPEEVARELALQTVAGSVELMRHSASTPAELIAQVSSPGGTTVRGLEVLASASFENIVSKCIVAAAGRAEELGRSDS